MNAAQLREHPLALSRWNRVVLFADKVLGFRPTIEEPPPGKKSAKSAGLVKKTAFDFIAGKFGEKSLDEVAIANGLNYDSFKSTVWKIRSERRRAS